MRDSAGDTSRQFWDRAAIQNAAWYVATGHTQENDEFFRHGAAETDALLAWCALPVGPADAVLEIGSGVGRMTRRLSELAGNVVAVDVSEQMLHRCAQNLSDRSNVTYLQVPGDGTLPLADAAATVVFSYITLQHVPSRQAQLRYLQEAGRVLASGGRLAIQVRGSGPRARALDWFGHAYHLVRGRRTLSRAWRGASLREEDIKAALAGLDVRVVRAGVRHRWVLAQTPGPAGAG